MNISGIVIGQIIQFGVPSVPSISSLIILEHLHGIFDGPPALFLFGGLAKCLLPRLPSRALTHGGRIFRRVNHVGVECGNLRLLLHPADRIDRRR